MQEVLKLFGVRENNLRNLDLTLPHDKLIVFTGVSGSGKSTLALDTIYAEGGRRYIETFSPYTRQFLDRLHQPDVASMQGVRPALALEQHNRVVNSRSTVGTVTEINDFLKVIWARLSTISCPECDCEIHAENETSVVNALDALLPKFKPQLLLISFSLRLFGDASFKSVVQTLLAEGFTRVLGKDGNTDLLEDLLQADAVTRNELEVVVDRIPLKDQKLSVEDRKRVIGSAFQAFSFGHGRLKLTLTGSSGELHSREFSQDFSCHSCGKRIPPPQASLFSFNSSLGACPTCKGFGNVLDLDLNRCVPNPQLTLGEGAIACWNTKATTRLLKKFKDFCEAESISFHTPWVRLSQADREKIENGNKKFPGLRGWFKKLQKKQYKMHVRVFLSRYRSSFTCSECHGTRLKPQALSYRVGGKTLPEIWALPIEKLLPFFEALREEQELSRALDCALSEICSRLRYLLDVGLSYLTLDRQSRTLSGGESQRVNLTSLLGAQLVHTTLVLDEPTVGLHVRDTKRLLNTLYELRDRPNTVIVVEHDAEIIRAADEVLDLGPGSGSAGGEIVFQGKPADLKRAKNSLTGKALADVPVLNPLSAKKTFNDGIEIIGACANNLKNVSVKIPLNCFTVLSGVSGSGKSTLVRDCLMDHAKRWFEGVPPEILFGPENPAVKDIRGLDALSEVIWIDQTALGKTPRSNAATYTGVWDVIRDCLAASPEAQRLGLSRSAFSFNVDGGRCNDCKGAGYHKIEMQFLADVHVECESCGGRRFQDKILDVRFNGKNAVDLLGMTLNDVEEFFEAVDQSKERNAVLAALKSLTSLGLGYLRLGQPLSHVSGGEAQRIKLASYLSSPPEKPCLFVLDEPTTGLHPRNIEDVLTAFSALLEAGHSVLCIEHNLEVISRADYLIELGPEGGEHGGEIVATGTPANLLNDRAVVNASPTLRELSQAMRADDTPQRKNISLPKPIQHAASGGIQILGASEHNLRNISLSIPHQSLTVLTGPSGSGKSTLAFDILFQEGQRRYIDCLSPYARQFVTQLQRPAVERISGIPPTVAVSQKSAPPLGVSTIATVTEVYQYLRLLYSKVGTLHCPKHKLPISQSSPEALAEEISAQAAGKRVYIFAPMVLGRKGHYQDLFERAFRAEISEARIDGRVKAISPDLKLERHKIHWVSWLIASLNPEKNEEILKEALAQALLLGNGTVEVSFGDKQAEPEIWSTARACPKCKHGFRELDPQDFSFSSTRGRCPRCEGKGWFEKGEVLEGFVPERTPCPSCKGARIHELARNVFLDKKPIHELSAMRPSELLKFLTALEYPKRLAPVLVPILRDVTARLQLLVDIGLDYLRLDREASSISGGEAQRLRLAGALGSPLSGICYVLDEPTIGLHPSDHAQLMQTLYRLRDQGNTVLVVEHDEDTIRAADYIIDMGPGGGSEGGRIVSQGSLEEIMRSPWSQTAQALRERQSARATSQRLEKPREWIEIKNARANNLKNISVEIPLQRLVSVIGVSGAGKSSLVHATLIPAVMETFKKSTKSKSQRTWDEIKIPESIERFIEIDQSPIGKTSTSTPASYLGIFDEIRKIFAALPESKARGYTAGYFSFNTGKGRCSGCNGKGYIQVPMSFLPDSRTVCDQCEGLRYNPQTLEIKYQDLSLGEILKLTMRDAKHVFQTHRKIYGVLETVNELGLGYLTLGQPSHTLSGGEAQRIKIAEELGMREGSSTLYVLDEPTIGLHMKDVERLLSVLNKLVERGNTVLVIEHNTDVILASDYLLELGPEAGDAGGELIFSGSPAELLRSKKSTPTKAALTIRDRIMPFKVVNQTKPLPPLMTKEHNAAAFSAAGD